MPHASSPATGAKVRRFLWVAGKRSAERTYLVNVVVGQSRMQEDHGFELPRAVGEVVDKLLQRALFSRTSSPRDRARSRKRPRKSRSHDTRQHALQLRVATWKLSPKDDILAKAFATRGRAGFPVSKFRTREFQNREGDKGKEDGGARSISVGLAGGVDVPLGHLFWT